jgi:hypothetical protein
MTDEANTTWALVVGIDCYDDPSLKSLDGAVADAVDAVGWLRALRVPDEQILLHAAPSQTSKRALDDLGLAYGPAREPDIWGSVHRLTQVTGGTRLFVFLSGHGLYEPTSQRLFLTQEAGVAGTYNNLGIDKYVQLLLSTGFRRTLLFMDGCLNYPYTETKRQEIEGSIYGGKVPPNGRPGNWLAASFAAKQGQRAAEIDGRGAFLHRLLDALDLQHPFADAIDLDFSTGARTIDLRRVIADDVRPAVEQAAGGLMPPVDQSPQLVPYGALGADDPCPVLTLPPVDIGVISIDLAPADATSAVEAIDFQVQFKPWTLRLPRPRGSALSIPATAHVPVGEQARIRCLTVPRTPWNVVHPIFDFPVTGEHPVHFELAQVTDAAAPTSSPAGRDSEQISVRILSAEGEEFAMLRNNEYARIGDALGSRVSPTVPTQIAPGVQLVPHETGPGFAVESGSEEQAGLLAALVAEAVRDVVPQDLIVATAASGTLPTATAQVEVRLPAGGAVTLAGPIAGQASLVAEVSADGSGWEALFDVPLKRLEDEPIIEVPPGRVQFRLDLPWGSYRHSIDAHLSAPAVLTMPDRVGMPPLRIRLGATGWAAGYTVVGIGGHAPRGDVRAGILGDARGALRVAPHERGAWLLSASHELASHPHRGGWIASIGDDPATVFPLSPVHTLAVEALGQQARVEPLTDVTLPEWDLIVATGRIEDIDPDRLTALCAGVTADEVLGLAAAHALHGRQQWDHLRIVLNELRRREWLGLDVDLITASLAAHTRQPMDPSLGDRLGERAARGEVPILRWGVALARQLAPSDDPRLADWRAKMQRIDATLSPRSVWTVWTE